MSGARAAVVADSRLRSFVWLAGEWLRLESRRLASVVNERRHVRCLVSLWQLREGQLTPRRVRAALLSLLRENGGTLGPRTVNAVRHAGRRILREAAMNDEWSGPNPFDLVRPLRAQRSEIHVPTLEELRLVLPRLGHDKYREALFGFILGPRPGETRALRKDDVDGRNRSITFRRSNARDTTKTGRNRTVPVPDWLWPILDEAMRASPSTLVFPAPNGQRQRCDVKMSPVLRRAYEAAGFVPAPRVRYYDLRHAAAHAHRLAGCDPLVIQRILGHSEQGATDRIYTRYLPLEYMREQLSKLRL